MIKKKQQKQKIKKQSQLTEPKKQSNKNEQLEDTSSEQEAQIKQIPKINQKSKLHSNIKEKRQIIKSKKIQKQKDNKSKKQKQNSESESENENENEDEEEEMEEEEENEENENINEDNENSENEEMEDEEDEKDSNNDNNKTKNSNKKQKEEIQQLSNPIENHYYTFRPYKDLYTLLYCSLIFKWIDTNKILIICDNTKVGYQIDLFLRSFKFNSIYLDKEMPLNTNNHFCTQFLKNNFNICIINTEYSAKSKNFAKVILDETQIPITIIYFDCFSKSLLEFHSFHQNTREIFHFISNKDNFLENYENLNENINFKEFEFDIQQMEHLRYRCEDMFNGIKKSDIKKEKMRKLNIELLHSKQMKKFFEDNPKEKENVIKTIEENTIKNFAPSVSFLPSYLIHSQNNIIADAIKKKFANKGRNNRRRIKKKTMEKYFEALDKGDGSQDLVKF